MAARKDEWSADALDELLDTSAPKLEARLLTLTREPKSPRIAAAAVEFFEKFPIRFREQLGAGAAGAGVAFLHGAKPSSFAKLKAPKAPNDVVPLWHQRACAALHAALGPRAKAKAKAKGAAVVAPWPKKATELHAEWLRRAERLEDLDGLLAHFATGPATQIAERGVALLRYPVEARIADAAAAFIARPPVNPGAETVAFTIAALLLAVHGNRSHRRAAEQLSSAVASLIWVERALPDVEAPKKKKTLSLGERGWGEGEFLRAIAEAPQDDGRVATFMDWLLERNDPRGTFISLQRAGKPVLKTLLKKHEKAWLGSLAAGAVKGSAVFRGGFVRDLTLRCWRGADVPLADEPLLALLEALAVHGGTNLPIPEWLAAAKWPSLKSLTMDPWILERLPDSLLTTLDTLGVDGNFVKPAVLQRVPPNVKTLLLRGDWREGAEEVARLVTLKNVLVETYEPRRWESLRGKVELEVLPAYTKMKSPAQ